jgi:hypothetical protein
MGFYLLFIVFFITGVFCAFQPKIAIFLFIILAIIVPTSSAFTNLTYLNGLFAVESFFIPLSFIMFVRLAILKKISLTKIEIFLFFPTFLIFLSYFLISGYKNGFDIDLIKEIRPILLLIETLVFLMFIRQIDLKVNFKIISKLAILAALSNCIFYIVLYFGIIVPSDLYYINNTYRYLDLSTYFSVYFIIHYLMSKQYKNISKSYFYNIAIFLSFISIIIANSRFIFLALFLALIFASITNYKFFIKRILQAFVVLVLFIGFSFIIDASRIIDSLGSDSILIQLSNRYLPAIIDINKMTNNQIIFGYGLGHYFEIPWFEYRDSIDNNNISIDCAYLTAYVKQGFLGLLCLFFSLLLLVSSSVGRHKFALLVFWGVMFIVSSSFYQIYPFGAVVYIAFLNNNEIK